MYSKPLLESGGGILTTYKITPLPTPTPFQCFLNDNLPLLERLLKISSTVFLEIYIDSNSGQSKINKTKKKSLKYIFKAATAE